CMQGTQVPWTF
nr:immunoglobulin light chain junction region [Macaca mulatta]MOX49605.1 immunoglobulin light chain junction region [Macaca mulatta]MOX51350.1 immunoglobulin light chain junction region [Macaca mulatta]